MKRVAAIDVGSNTMLLLVAERGGGGALVAVRDRCEYPRLGKGVDSSKRLDEAAVARALQILRDYRAMMDEDGVEAVAAVGTQALREAHNAADFLGPAAEILGSEIEVIAGEREAALVYRSVAEAFPDLAAGNLVVADVGGGSTEIICGKGGQVTSMVSVPIGAVRMTERHLHGDPPTADQGRAMMADIDAHLAGLDLPRGAALIGTAGTATTLATVEQRCEYQADKVQGFRIGIGEVERQVARYLEMSLAEKRHMRGLDHQRADVIAGGAAIYARLAEHLGTDAIITSDRGVRWGLAHELFEG